MILKIAIRYFFTKNKDKVVSIISYFSCIGITLGVAALIVVMGIMRGFREELITNIIGLNSHIIMHKVNESFDPNILNDINLITNFMKTSSNEALFISKNNKQGILVKGIDFQDLKLKFKNLTCNQNLLAKCNIDQADDKNINSEKENLEISLEKENLEISLEKENLEISKESKDKQLNKKDNIRKEDNNAKLNNENNDICANQQNYIAISKNLANNLGIKINDSIKLIAPSLTPSIIGSIPKAKVFHVGCIFESNLYEYDMKVVFINNDIAKNLFSSKEDIEIYIKDPEKTEIVMENLINLNSEYAISTWQEQNESLLKALEIEKISMLVILFLLIVVSGFNIISSLTILVKDKLKDIAILKTIGMSNFKIMLIFFINGLLIGFIGICFGIMLGLVIGNNLQNIKTFLEKITSTTLFDPIVYFLYHLPCKISTLDIAYISILSILLCVLAAIYPSYKASKIKIIDIIKQ